MEEFINDFCKTIAEVIIIEEGGTNGKAKIKKLNLEVMEKVQYTFLKN